MYLKNASIYYNLLWMFPLLFLIKQITINKKKKNNNKKHFLIIIDKPTILGRVP